MKILYIDIAIDGHHQSYLKALINQSENESILIIPEKIENLACKQYTYGKVDLYNKKFKEYKIWIKEIFKIVQKESPDIVHFLYGDVFYKFFGYGLHFFKKYKTIVTFHAIRQSKLARISLKTICTRVNIVVFHTAALLEEAKNLGIGNAQHIEYPHFNVVNKVSQKFAKNFFEINEESKLLVCLGNTRYDKGLDILLSSLKYIKEDFKLLIAGNEETYDNSYIQEKTLGYEDKVTIYLKYLTDEEFGLALNAADIIMLPYRRQFNGASGPLGEGAWLKKIIIGPDHGSLGEVIKSNHLGYIFESENEVELAKTIEKAISTVFYYDSKAINYRDNLTVEAFLKSYKLLYKQLVIYN